MEPNEVLRVDDGVTGCICGILGTSLNGKFILEEVLWPGLAPQKPIKAPAEDKFVALVSGLNFGAEGEAATDGLALQMMVDYITGHLGGSQDIAHAASVVRVLVAGNSILQKAAAESAKAGSSTDIATGAQDLDTALLQLCSAVPVDIMAGKTDPSQFMMPQQPLHRCLFPNSSRLKSLTAVTNPYEAVIEGANFIGTSGQNVDDLWQYTKNDDVQRIDLLENTLKWRHIAPTTPETLACFPYKNEDPFILEETPHVYFAGNQPEFAEKLVEDKDTGVKTRVIQVPSFAKTSTIVLLNLRTLECEPISFNL